MHEYTASFKAFMTILSFLVNGRRTPELNGRLDDLAPEAANTISIIPLPEDAPTVVQCLFSFKNKSSLVSIVLSALLAGLRACRFPQS